MRIDEQTREVIVKENEAKRMVDAFRDLMTNRESNRVNLTSIERFVKAYKSLRSDDVLNLIVKRKDATPKSGWGSRPRKKSKEVVSDVGGQ